MYESLLKCLDSVECGHDIFSAIADSVEENGHDPSGWRWIAANKPIPVASLKREATCFSWCFNGMTPDFKRANIPTKYLYYAYQFQEGQLAYYCSFKTRSKAYEVLAASHIYATTGQKTSVELKFEEFLNRWENASLTTWKTRIPIKKDVNADEIISMGVNVIPPILKKMKHIAVPRVANLNLFEILREILGYSISSRGIVLQQEEWLRWGELYGLID